MSPRQLLSVFAALLVFTVITVAAAGRAPASLEIWIAMGIATVKASLVAIWFMHLRYDSPLNAVLLVFSLAFVTLFLGITLMDAHEYQPDVLPPPAAESEL